ncbi:hypothetical protein NL108_013881 [Boleophthalmus pectinirostris]|uniref:uncharacterized protein LOC110160702 n=1 Tax=Boleophthalmus pectinirostris TaxID=150288 RepID=UPI000A1C5E80|nr:uncharacterized protein LOC110160702 [Boleophthalmus pectinirostris]KAJ0058385.1 hypothetical protein NL108_013881 [Boleophthalmus pectinirostris]
MASMRFHLFGLFGLLGVLSTLCAVEMLEMHTNPAIVTTCGENVTLRCDVTTNGALDITEFSWKDSKDICNWGQPTSQTDIQCMNKTSTNSYNYSLTIYNIQPEHKGTYHCQLRSKQGSRNGQTIVRVQNCIGNSKVRVTSTNGTCIFEEVFPKPIMVLWKQHYDESVYYWATTTVKENNNGKFTVISTIRLRKDPTHGLYTCSLMLSFENELGEQKLDIARNITFAGADSLTVHWFGVMLAMVLGMVMVQA